MVLRILVVGENGATDRLLRSTLRRSGYEFCACGIDSAAKQIEQFGPELVALDREYFAAADRSLTEFCEQVRGMSPVPIAVFTAADNSTDLLVAALQSGADTWICSAADPREIRSRIGALLRRAAMPALIAGHRVALEFGQLQIDPVSRTVKQEGRQVELTALEFQVLYLMAGEPGRVFTREQLLDHAWGDAEFREPRTVDVHILHLRDKLEVDPKNPRMICTARGLGYKFVAPLEGPETT